MQLGDKCLCGGTFIDVIDHRFDDPAHFGGIFGAMPWRVCDGCGGALSNSGKYIPPRSGWDVPSLDDPKVVRRIDVERRRLLSVLRSIYGQFWHATETAKLPNMRDLAMRYFRLRYSQRRWIAVELGVERDDELGMTDASRMFAELRRIDTDGKVRDLVAAVELMEEAEAQRQLARG